VGVFKAPQQEAAPDSLHCSPARRAAVQPFVSPSPEQHRARHRLRPAAQQQGAQFDGPKFTWIGSGNREVSVCVAYGDRAGVTKFADLMSHERCPDGREAHRPTPHHGRVRRPRCLFRAQAAGQPQHFGTVRLHRKIAKGSCVARPLTLLRTRGLVPGVARHRPRPLYR
jgi:hypothetical protein